MSKRNKMGGGKHAMKSPRGVHDTLPQVELSNEAAQQVEKELCWCILQLQTSLILHKMTPKQAQDISHTINILKSPTAPLVKKRQIMRNTFGDYRAKMAEEENQFRKGNM
uniref:(California timema) hypothetical protein n=1 Tax=Timema californicum TaxID=61474 RepID=A0A7R9IZ33_TIMCA|nr:unnamed protein product [Timema californicum]